MVRTTGDSGYSFVVPNRFLHRRQVLEIKGPSVWGGTNNNVLTINDNTPCISFDLLS